MIDTAETEYTTVQGEIDLAVQLADRRSREKCARIAADATIECAKLAADAVRDAARIYKGQLAIG